MQRELHKFLRRPQGCRWQPHFIGRGEQRIPASTIVPTMGKKGKKTRAGKPTKKEITKRLDNLASNLKIEIEGADIFAPLQPTEDCSICFVPIARNMEGTFHTLCCGKSICYACEKENARFIETLNERNAAKNKKGIEHVCPFCREPEGPLENYAQQLETMASLGNDWAYFQLGSHYMYSDGLRVLSNETKSLDCFIRAAELGSADACISIAAFCYPGARVTAADTEKATLFCRAAAVRGSVLAHDCIGRNEYGIGNYETGIRHWIFAAEHGKQSSVNMLRSIYNADGKIPGKEFIPKEYMDKVYRASYAAQEEVYSEAREKYQRHY